MRRTFLLAASLIAVSAVSAGSASAQGRGRNTNGVPPGQRPAAGMCRIWINGVPPGHQPAATNCATAQANLPLNARIIYGDGVLPSTGNILSRTRQLSNGSWVLDRYRTDANGNTYLISTSPVRSRGAVKVRGNENDNDNEVEGNDRDHGRGNDNEVEGRGGDHGRGNDNGQGKAKGKGKGHG